MPVPIPSLSRKLYSVFAGLLCLAPSVSPAAKLGALAGATAPAALTEEQRIVHVLNRLGYGPRPGDVERIRRMGLRQYIARQLHPETIDDSALEARLKNFPLLDVPTAELVELEAEARERRRELARQTGGSPPGAQTAQPVPEALPEARMRERYRGAVGDDRHPRRIVSELQQAKLLRAVYSERQLQEVMTDFWLNHFNVFAGKGLVRAFLSEYEREAIRPHALGRFEDLLRATARSPAMLFYLDNWRSVTPDLKRPGGRGRAFPSPAEAGPASPAGMARQRQPGVNENYARELLELHTLGVDGGYTQQDVQEVARCFTGWSIHQPFGSPRRDLAGRMRGAARLGERNLPPGSFVFRDWAHDQGEKVALGVKILAGGGQRDGEIVLTLLARHPSTAKLIATKLCRRFVADEPPASLVAAVAATFERTQGDIRACLQTLFDAPEFFAPEAYRAKVKTPLELVASALRATDANIRDAQALVGALARLGMPLYGCQPPTGYKDVAAAWVNAGALLNRLNFALLLASGKLPGVSVPMTAGPADGAAQAEALLDRYLGNEVSATTRRALLAVVADPTRLKARKPAALDAAPALEAEDGDEAGLPIRRRARMAPLDRGLGPASAIRRYDLALEALARQDAPLPLAAQLTGLALGSPEFQRR